jgi:NADH:ubiquinone oxidoreductase subunit 5 (subunit L)/multisubunit Na+/H+ antiporter MnhA subunit
MGAGEASSWFDAQVIDAVVNDAGWVTRIVARVSSWSDKWIVDGVGVNGPAIVARLLSYPARLLEWGLVQWYALVMIAGLLGFGVYYVWK